MKTLSWSLLGLFLVLACLAVAEPASPPLPSTLSYPEIVLVSEKQRTYLEVELENHTDEAEHTHFAIDLYYTQLGGWFESTKRTLLYKQTDFNTSDRVRFERLGADASSPFKIYLPDNTSGKMGGYFLFKPPATYRQAQTIKPTVYYWKKKPAN